MMENLMNNFVYYKFEATNANSFEKKNFKAFFQ